MAFRTRPKLTDRLVVMMTPQELTSLREVATRHQVTMSDLVRWRLLSDLHPKHSGSGEGPARLEETLGA